MLVDKEDSGYMYSFSAAIGNKHCINMLSSYKEIRIIAEALRPFIK